MRMKRLWHSLRMLLLNNDERRAAYARKAGIYAGIGKHVRISPKILPVYSELIRFHDNVYIARGVEFITHDTISTMLNHMPENMKSEIVGEKYRFHEHIGCIEIMDNVFIGNHAIVLYGTKIGPNVIVAAGSVVNHDCKPNSVYAGVPAKRVGSFDDFVQRRKDNETKGLFAVTAHNQALEDEEILNAWNIFDADHQHLA